MPGFFGTQAEPGGWLGVAIDEVTPEKAKAVKLSDIHGVVISDVSSDSPAAKAGLKAGDMVTEYNGQRVEGAIEFRRLVHETPAGRVAQMAVWRDGHAQKLSVTVGESPAFGGAGSESGSQFPATDPFAGAEPQLFGRGRPARPGVGDDTFNGRGNGSAAGALRLGVAVEDLTAERGNSLGVPDGTGVLITEVRPGSAGEAAGLKAGDVITKIDNDRVRGLAELREQLRNKREEKEVTLGVWRKGSEINVKVQPAKPQAPSERRRNKANDSDRVIPL
jgi:serine protease Do